MVGLHNRQKNESTYKENTTTNLASQIVANKDINITASNDINQTGSHVTSLGGDISYEAGNNVNIQASKDFYETSSNEQSYNASMSYGTGGVSGSAGFSLASGYETDIVHNNSTVEAQQGKVSIKTGTQAGSEGDLNIKGGVVYAKNVDIDVKGDLNIESVQDTHRKESKNVGANLSISATGDKEGKNEGTEENPVVTTIKGGLTGGSIGGNYGQSKEDGAWVGQQSAIIGSDSVDIEVGETLSNKGAVIANADYIYNNETGKMELGNDKGNLTVTAKEFVFEDIKDHYNSSSYNYGMSASFGQVDDKGRFIPSLLESTRKLKFTFLSKGYEKEQINRATAGKGDIFVDGVIASEEQLAGLNRDVTKSQEITKDLQTGALDAELTLDLRLLTSSGRKEIWDQLTGLPGNIKYSLFGITVGSYYSAKVVEGLFRDIVLGQEDIKAGKEQGKSYADAIIKMDMKDKEVINIINSFDFYGLDTGSAALFVLSKYLNGEGLISAENIYFTDGSDRETNYYGFHPKESTNESDSIFVNLETNSNRNILKTILHETAHLNKIASDDGAKYAASIGMGIWDIANFFGARSFSGNGDTGGIHRFTSIYNSNSSINNDIIEFGTNLAKTINEKDREYALFVNSKNVCIHVGDMEDTNAYRVSDDITFIDKHMEYMYKNEQISHSGIWIGFDKIDQMSDSELIARENQLASPEIHTDIGLLSLFNNEETVTDTIIDYINKGGGDYWTIDRLKNAVGNGEVDNSLLGIFMPSLYQTLGDIGIRNPMNVLAYIGDFSIVEMEHIAPSTDLPRIKDSTGKGFQGANRTDGDRSYKHEGFDIYNIKGDFIYAPIDGKVVRIGRPYPDPIKNGILQSITIKNEQYIDKILYVKPEKWVTIGTNVKQGDIIGTGQYLKNSHNHVHIEIREGSTLKNPQDYLYPNLNIGPEPDYTTTNKESELFYNLNNIFLYR